MVDREIVRERFYAGTIADGTPEQRVESRRKQFNRAVDWAEDHDLIGVREIEGVTYLWLSRPDSDGDDEDEQE
jgi:hypothetical protein